MKTIILAPELLHKMDAHWRVANANWNGSTIADSVKIMQENYLGRTE